jgi:hypothetical protein
VRHRYAATSTFLAVVLLCGCGAEPRPNHSVPPLRTSGVARELQDAADWLVTQNLLDASFDLTIESGITPMNEAHGSGTFSLRRGLGSADYEVRAGGSVQVRRTAALLRQLLQETSGGQPIVKEFDLRSTGATSLVEVTSPGLDPLQLPILFVAAARGASKSVRQVIVKEGTAAPHTEYAAVLNLHDAVNRVPAPDRQWVQFLAEQAPGGCIEIRVRLVGHMIQHLRSDLPVYDPTREAGDPTLHSRAVIQISGAKQLSSGTPWP